MKLDTSNWIEVVSDESVREGEVLGVKLSDRHIALYRLDGLVFATDGICTHQRVLLCDGFLEDGQIECPLHQGRFDVRTGKALCAPLSVDLKTYPVRVIDQTIFVMLETGSTST
jgi:naphthalene 1,2-dioxygenase system ferredoxin subunit